MKIVMRCAYAVPLLFFLLSFSIGAADRYEVPPGDCPSLGPENAPLTIIEFIDYQ